MLRLLDIAATYGALIIGRPMASNVTIFFSSIGRYCLVVVVVAVAVVDDNNEKNINLDVDDAPSHCSQRGCISQSCKLTLILSYVLVFHTSPLLCPSLAQNFL